MALYVIVLLVALERLVELPLAARNTKALLAEGAVETGAAHYPLFIMLHASWLLAILFTSPPQAPVNLWLLSFFIIMQVGRLWVIATLGRFWTTRIISPQNAPLIKKGPYRYFPHPNYLIVSFEIALLPLVFGNWKVAIIWSVLNALLIAWRIKIENVTLAHRGQFIH